MIQIKKLKRPTKKSGNFVLPGGVSRHKGMKVLVIYYGNDGVIQVDRVKEKNKKS
jgi:hypothetical protein